MEVNMKNKITFKQIKIGIVILIVLSGYLSTFQYAYSNPKDLNMFIAKKTEKALTVGMSVAFIEDDQIVKRGNYGYADKEDGIHVDDKTIFQIGSISKTITATAIMQLYEQGIIDLDTDINAYLDIDIVNPKSPDVPITIRSLLNHTSGLKDNMEVLHGVYSYNDTERKVPLTLRDFQLAYLLPNGEFYDEDINFYKLEQGKKEYSNVAYALLGYLVEVVTETPFNEYCNASIFQPLSMDDTGWFLSEVDTNRLTYPYFKGKEKLPHYSSPTYPDGMLKTTVEDYSKFLTATMNKGIYEDVRILQESSVNAMLNSSDGLGLGWDTKVLEEFLINTKGVKIVGHAGGDPGVFCLTFYNPLNKKGVIMFSNTDTTFNLRMLNSLDIIKRLIVESGVYE